MGDFFHVLQSQWLQASDRGSCEILNPAGRDDFLMISGHGRLAAATQLCLSGIGDSILFVLNQEGKGTWNLAGDTAILPSSLTYIQTQENATLDYQRFAGSHRFVLLSFRLPYLKRLLEAQREKLTPPIASAVFGRGTADGVPRVETEPLSENAKAFAQALSSPPVISAASHLWFHSKAMEFVATHCYEQTSGESGGFFCSQQKRLAQERVAKAKAYLADHLDESLKLDAIARAVGTSPHYLSRIFSGETGQTLSRYLRSLRIKRASQLLSTGHMNISEVAIEVGYRSQSHFSRAFEIELGCSPSQFTAQRRSNRQIPS